MILVENSFSVTILVILFDNNEKYFYNSCRHYMLKVNNKNNRTKCKTCLKLTSNAPERLQ